MAIPLFFIIMYIWELFNKEGVIAVLTIVAVSIAFVSGFYPKQNKRLSKRYILEFFIVN